MLRQGTKTCISNNNWEETLVNTIRLPANSPYTIRIRREFGGQTLSTSERETQGGGVSDEYKLAGEQPLVCKPSKLQLIC